MPYPPNDVVLQVVPAEYVRLKELSHDCQLGPDQWDEPRFYEGLAELFGTEVRDRMLHKTTRVYMLGGMADLEALPDDVLRLIPVDQFLALFPSYP